MGKADFLKKKIGIYDYLIKEDERTSEGKYTGDKNKKGNPHGRGKMVYKDGRIYQGEWKDGKRSGEGFIEYSDGSEYDGEWEDDMPFGYGKGFINVLEKGVMCIYAGEFFNGIFHGEGSLGVRASNNYFSDMGDRPRRYIGEWKYGKKEGKGKDYFPSSINSITGHMISGIRKNDDLIEKNMSFQIDYDSFEKEMEEKIKNKFHDK